MEQTIAATILVLTIATLIACYVIVVAGDHFRQRRAAKICASVQPQARARSSSAASVNVATATFTCQQK